MIGVSKHHSSQTSVLSISTFMSACALLLVQSSQAMAAGPTHEHGPVSTGNVSDSVFHEPASLETLLANIAWATERCRAYQIEERESDHAELFVEQSAVLLTIKQVVTSERAEWRAEIQLQHDFLQLCIESVRAGIHTKLSIGGVFSSVEWLPESPKTSTMILQALDIAEGNPSAVWVYELHRHISDSDFEHIHRRVVDGNIHDMLLSDVVLLALRGKASDVNALGVLQHRVQSEWDAGRRLRSEFRPAKIQSYLDLQVVRRDPASLLAWAIESPSFGPNMITRWAFQATLKQVGPNSQIWSDMWDRIESHAVARVDESIRRSGVLGNSLTQNQKHQMISANIDPWIQWAESNGVTISESIRRYEFPLLRYLQRVPSVN